LEVNTLTQHDEPKENTTEIPFLLEDLTHQEELVIKGKNIGSALSEMNRIKQSLFNH
jgi:hypothetical protein